MMRRSLPRLAKYPLDGRDHLVRCVILNVMSRSRNQDVFHIWCPGCELVVELEFQILFERITWKLWVLLRSAEQNDGYRWQRCSLSSLFATCLQRLIFSPHCFGQLGHFIRERLLSG